MGALNWVLATHNPGKVRELRDILSAFPVNLLGLKDCGIEEDSPEAGETFLENAMQKARFYYDKTTRPVLADDSGLEVDALNGAPGIYSARFGGFATHAEKCRYLLELLADVPPPYRTARFQCAAVYYDGMRYYSAQGSVEGFIGQAPVGEGGFGYDPVFHLQAEGGSLAQLEARAKNAISHRGRAFRKLVDSVLRFDSVNL